MATYFDDVFHRGITVGSSTKPHKPHMRRSSTARSIGARSDFDASINGDEYDARSVAPDDPEREAQRKEADAHLHLYISEQLQRVKDHDEHDGYVDDEEYETHA